jgi:hypothetical protein
MPLMIERLPPFRATEHRALMPGRIGGSHTQFETLETKRSPEFLPRCVPGIPPPYMS